MRIPFRGLAFVMSLLLAGAVNAAQPVRINGSTTVANTIVVPKQADIEAKAGVKLDIIPNSSGRGIADVVAGRADIGMISSDLDDVVARLNRERESKIDGSQLKVFDLGGSQVRLVVNAANPVRRLSTEQLRDILRGKVTNWKAVGGPDVPIRVVTETKFGAMRMLVEDELLKGEAITDAAAEAPEAPLTVQYVGRAVGSIGFVTSALVDQLPTNVTPLGTDVNLRQRLALVTKGEPSAQTQKVISAITGK